MIPDHLTRSACLLLLCIAVSCGGAPPFETYAAGRLAAAEAEARAQERPATPPFAATTEVKISRGSWSLNGKVVHARSRAEGLLLNVRMVNATFEDRNPATCPKGFDPDLNAADFIAKVPEYVAHGVDAFTLSLQGGSPGYEGALNSAFEADGSLRPDYMARVAKVIEACDLAGAAVFLACFSPEQDQVLRDDEAVKNAVVQTASWVRARGYKNVCLEIADEHGDKGYDREIIKDPGGVRDLIRLAHVTTPGLLASSSGMGGGRVALQIATEGDFVLIHFTAVPIDEILERVATADKVSKPIVCNKDGRTGEEGARALETAVNAVCSWGYSNVKQNQHYPFRFEGAADDPVVYAKFKELAAP